MLIECVGTSVCRGRKRRAEQDLAIPRTNGRPLVCKKQRRNTEKNQQHARYWDTLSKVRLSRRALREFDRRRETDTQHRHREGIQSSRGAFAFRDIRDFARRGGPSLAHLRGFAQSTTMSRSSTRSQKRSAKSGRSESSKPPNSTPYTPNYEQKLIDSGIYPADHSDDDAGPTNEEEIFARLTVSRPSLSPSRFTEQDFKKFRRDARHAQTETSTMQTVFSAIEGGDHGYRNAADLTFSRMRPMAEGLASAKPDLYDGATLENIDLKVRAALEDQILPSRKSHVPAVPNFFTEGKSAAGRADIARLQACHDGAIGARAMHALQNYGNDTLVFDGKAYSFSNTYHHGTGTLQLYATHPTIPEQSGRTSEQSARTPEYRMTQLKAYAMTSDRESFQKGACAYRNLRDYANEQRESFIGQANERASTTISTSIRTHSFIEESDTSTDELSRDEVTVKRVRS